MGDAECSRLAVWIQVFFVSVLFPVILQGVLGSGIDSSRMRPVPQAPGHVQGGPGQYRMLS